MKFRSFIFLLFISFAFFIVDANALTYYRVTNTNGLNLRTGPGTSYKTIEKVKYNDMVLVENTLKTDNQNCSKGWYFVKYENKTGYICSNYIDSSNISTLVKKKNTPVKNSPSNKYKNYTKINAYKNVSMKTGKRTKAKGCSAGYYKITINGQNKYVCANNTRDWNNSSTIIVSSRGGSYLKSNPKSKKNYKYINYGTGLSMQFKNKVKGVGCKEGYYKVNYKNTTKYICSKYVARTNRIGVLKVNSSPARIKNNSTSPTITTFKYGEDIVLLSKKKYSGANCSKGYFKIRANNKIGYICSNYVSLSNWTTRTDKNIAIFTKPDSSKEKISSIKSNSKIVLQNKDKIKGYGCSEGYFKIYINGKTGYICSSNTKYGKYLINDEKKGATKIPILTWHRIVSDDYKNKHLKNDEWTAGATIFEKQIKYLYDNNYNPISMDKFYCWYKGKCWLPKKSVVITFDDGNAEDYYLVMPILKKYNFYATSFVVGSRTEKNYNYDVTHTKRTFLTKDIMNKMKIEYPKFELQSHSYNFHYREKGSFRIKFMTKKEIQNDFDKNKKYGFKYIAYPYGSYTKDLTDKVKENGYRLGFKFSSLEYATRNSKQFEIPRIKINGFSTVDTLKQRLNN